jgi:hypothetical protein
VDAEVAAIDKKAEEHMRKKSQSQANKLGLVCRIPRAGEEVGSI